MQYQLSDEQRTIVGAMAAHLTAALDDIFIKASESVDLVYPVAHFLLNECTERTVIVGSRTADPCTLIFFKLTELATVNVAQLIGRSVVELNDGRRFFMLSDDVYRYAIILFLGNKTIWIYRE